MASNKNIYLPEHEDLEKTLADMKAFWNSTKRMEQLSKDYIDKTLLRVKRYKEELLMICDLSQSIYHTFTNFKNYIISSTIKTRTRHLDEILKRIQQFVAFCKKNLHQISDVKLMEASEQKSEVMELLESLTNLVTEDILLQARETCTLVTKTAKKIRKLNAETVPARRPPPIVCASNTQKDIRDICDITSSCQKRLDELEDTAENVLASSEKLTSYLTMEYEKIWRSHKNETFSFEMSEEDHQQNLLDEDRILCKFEILKNAITKESVSCSIASQDIHVASGTYEITLSNTLHFNIESDNELDTQGPVFIMIPYSPRMGQSGRIPTLRLEYKEDEKSSKERIAVPMNAPHGQKGSKVPMAEFRITDFKCLRNVILMVTGKSKVQTKKIGSRGGRILSQMVPNTKLVIPPKVLKTNKTMKFEVIKNATDTVKDITPILKDRNQSLPIKDFGALSSISFPEEIVGAELILPGPSSSQKQYKDIRFLQQDTNLKWTATEFSPMDSPNIRKTVLNPNTQSAVVVSTSTKKLDSEKIQEIGETVQDLFRTEIVSIFYAERREGSIPQIHIECCLKEKYDSRVEHAEKFGFRTTCPPIEDIILKTTGGRAELSVNVTGQIQLANGLQQMEFNAALNSAKVIDNMDVTQSESPDRSYTGHVKVNIPVKHTNLAFYRQSLDTTLVLPIVVCQIKDQENLIQPILKGYKQWWDPKVAMAIELLKDDATVIDSNNIRTIMRVGLQLSGGTVKQILHRFKDDLWGQWDLAVTTWQEKGNGRTIYDLFKALDKVEACKRAAETIETHPDFLEFIRTCKEQDVEPDEDVTVSDTSTENESGTSEHEDVLESNVIDNEDTFESAEDINSENNLSSSESIEEQILNVPDREISFMTGTPVSRCRSVTLVHARRSSSNPANESFGENPNGEQPHHARASSVYSLDLHKEHGICEDYDDGEDGMDMESFTNRDDPISPRDADSTDYDKHSCSSDFHDDTKEVSDGEISNGSI